MNIYVFRCSIMTSLIILTLMKWMKLEVPGRVENWAFPPCWNKNMKKTLLCWFCEMLTEGRCGCILTLDSLDQFFSFNAQSARKLQASPDSWMPGGVSRLWECFRHCVLLPVTKHVFFSQTQHDSACLAKQRNGHDLINGSWRRDVFEIVYQNDWALLGYVIYLLYNLYT